MYTEHSTECMNICLNMACVKWSLSVKVQPKNAELTQCWMETNEHKVFILRKKYAQQTLSLTLNSERIMHANVDHLYILKSMMGKNIFNDSSLKKYYHSGFFFINERSWNPPGIGTGRKYS